MQQLNLNYDYFIIRLKENMVLLYHKGISQFFDHLKVGIFIGFIEEIFTVSAKIISISAFLLIAFAILDCIINIR